MKSGHYSIFVVKLFRRAAHKTNKEGEKHTQCITHSFFLLSPSPSCSQIGKALNLIIDRKIIGLWSTEKLLKSFFQIIK